MELSASNLLQTLSEKKKEIAIGSTSVIAGIAILIGYFQSGPSALNYAEAQAAFSKWDAAPQDEKLYQIMKETIRSVPALEKKYEATIVQNLLNTNKIEEALEMAGRSLNRVKDDVPFHTIYAETSLLIEQGNFQKSLENAVALKEQMGSTFLTDSKGGALLYAFNLLRIACLQQELKNKPGEKAAWEELEGILAAKTPVTQRLLGSFSEKLVDLTQYIAERKKSL